MVFPMRATRYSRGLRAARSPPMTSFAHGHCKTCSDVPGTCSVRHVGLRARGHMGATCFPNLNNLICPHFSHRRWYLVPGAKRFKADSRSRKRACLGRPQNTKLTSHAASRGAGTVSEIVPCSPLGSPFPSVTQPTSPVWIGPCPIFSHAMSFAFCTHFDTHSGTFTSGASVSPKDPGISIPPSSACAHSHQAPARPRMA